MAAIELVVTDLDGTLWHTDDEIDPELRAAWAELEARVPILVATGRRITSTRVPLERLGLAPPAIVLNGALGIDLASDERFHRSPFPADQAASVLAAFAGCGLDPCVYVDGDATGPEVLLSESPSTNPGHAEALAPSALVTDLASALDDFPVLGFSIIGAQHGVLADAERAIGGTAETHLDRSLDFPGLAAITVAPKGQSKWDGVRAYCDRHGIDGSKVLAVGDGPNDVELLEAAAVAVVPGVAHPAAVRLADHTIPSAADGGWARLPSLVSTIMD